jgi:hypothetical protein
MAKGALLRIKDALWGKQAISTAVLSEGKKGDQAFPSLYPNQYEHKTTSAQKSDGLDRQR